MFVMVLDLWLKYAIFSKISLNIVSLASFMSSKFYVKEEMKEASIERNKSEQSNL